VSRFAHIVDTKSWGNLGDVFAEDINFDYGTRPGERTSRALCPAWLPIGS
jgi:hypothetical protein